MGKRGREQFQERRVSYHRVNASRGDQAVEPCVRLDQYGVSPLAPSDARDLAMALIDAADFAEDL